MLYVSSRGRKNRGPSSPVRGLRLSPAKIRGKESDHISFQLRGQDEKKRSLTPIVVRRKGLSSSPSARKGALVIIEGEKNKGKNSGRGYRREKRKEKRGPGSSNARIEKKKNGRGVKYLDDGRRRKPDSL